MISEIKVYVIGIISASDPLAGEENVLIETGVIGVASQVSFVERVGASAVPVEPAVGLFDAAAVAIVPGMIVLERWLPGESLGMRIHAREVGGAKVSAPGTGAGDLPVSDAVRGESLGGRPITRMG
jgi:hypothetical protein